MFCRNSRWEDDSQKRLLNYVFAGLTAVLCNIIIKPLMRLFCRNFACSAPQKKKGKLIMQSTKFVPKILLLLFVSTLLLSACVQSLPNTPESSKPVATELSASSAITEASDDNGLVITSSLELKFAENFTVDYCEGGYKLITIKPTGQQFLLVPQDTEPPAGLDDNITALKMPLDNILISSTPTVSLINAIGGLGHISLVTSDIDAWYIEEVKTAMQDGEIAYIGDYRAPDFEMITAAGTPFSVFSTMLSGAPEVDDKLKELEIPVMLDQSSFEKHPLARTEWMKLYGAMFDLEENAEKAFNEQAAVVEELTAKESAGKTAAVFYITSSGNIYARNAGDYIVKMLELAGGEYIMADMKPEESGNTQMEAEAFYAAAKDADYIIYIHNMGGRPADMEAFVGINEVLADFKAVKENNVWCTTPDFFQIAHTLGFMIKDVNTMLSGNADESAYTYLFRLK